MKTSIKLIGFWITGIIVVCCLNSVLAASGTDTVNEDYYVTHTISFTSGDYIDISYTMDVTSGPYIDVYFLDSQAYTYFQDGSAFSYYSAMTDLNTLYSSNSIRLTEHGTYYLIFDNTEIGTAPPWNGVTDIAYVSYTLNTEIHYPSSSVLPDVPGDDFSFDWTLLILLFTILITVIVVIAGVASSQKNKQAPIAPPPGYAQAPPSSQQKYCSTCGKSIPQDSSMFLYGGAK